MDRQFNFTLLLEYFIFLHCCNKTTNLLINYYEVFYWVLMLFLLTCILYSCLDRLITTPKAIGYHLRAQHWVSAWPPHILFKNINFPLNIDQTPTSLFLLVVFNPHSYFSNFGWIYGQWPSPLPMISSSLITLQNICTAPQEFFKKKKKKKTLYECKLTLKMTD